MKNVDAWHLKGKKWNDLFDNEQELIMAMFKCDVTSHYPHCVKGYEYVSSFRKYYEKNGVLTEKQMVQLKRLSGAIYAHLNGAFYY